MRQYDRAIATWDRVIELDPKFIPAYRGRGKIYLEGAVRSVSGRRRGSKLREWLQSAAARR